jgi:hypothetical protein
MSGSSMCIFCCCKKWKLNTLLVLSYKLTYQIRIVLINRIMINLIDSDLNIFLAVTLSFLCQSIIIKWLWFLVISILVNEKPDKYEQTFESFFLIKLIEKLQILLTSTLVWFRKPKLEFVKLSMPLIIQNEFLFFLLLQIARIHFYHLFWCQCCQLLFLRLCYWNDLYNVSKIDFCNFIY